MATSIKEILAMRGQAPYQKPITAVVAAAGTPRSYTNNRDETRQSLVIALADKTQAVKVTVYDTAKFARFRTGATLTIKNFIRKPDSFIITNVSKVFPATPMKVPDSIVKEGLDMVFPPPAPVRQIKDLKVLPQTTKVSLQGKVVKEEALQMLDTKHGRDVPLRHVTIQDSTGEIRLAMWRDMAHEAVALGEFLKVTDVAIHHFKGDVECGTIALTKVQVIDQPEEEKTFTFTSLVKEDTIAQLLLEDGTDINVQLNLIMSALPDVQEDDVEEYVIDNCPFDMKCDIRGTEVVRVTALTKCQ